MTLIKKRSKKCTNRNTLFNLEGKITKAIKTFLPTSISSNSDNCICLLTAKASLHKYGNRYTNRARYPVINC